MRYVIKKPSIAAEQSTVCEIVPRQNAERCVREEFGFARENGALVAGFGAAEVGLEFPQGEIPVRTCALKTLFGVAYALVCKSGKIYHCGAGERVFAPTDVVLSAEPVVAYAFDAEDAYVISDGRQTAVFRAGGVFAAREIPAFSAAAYFYGRLWIVPKNSPRILLFSAPQTVRDFSPALLGGGNIELPDPRGDILALRACGDYLYVFRERGLQRLFARGKEIEFDVNEEFSCSRVYPQTVAEEGGRLFWLAEDGLYLFDGKLRSFGENGFGSFAAAEDFSPSAAVAYGQYFLCVHMHTGTGEARGVFAIDLRDGKTQRVLTEAERVFSCNGEAYAAFSGKVEKLVYGGASTRCAVYELDNPLKNGVLSELRMGGNGVFAVTFESERGKRVTEVNLVGKESAVRVGLTGFRYRCEVRSYGAACELRNMSVRFSTKRG